MLLKCSCVLTAISICIGLLSSKIHNGDDTPKDNNNNNNNNNNKANAVQKVWFS